MPLASVKLRAFAIATARAMPGAVGLVVEVLTREGSVSREKRVDMTRLNSPTTIALLYFVAEHGRLKTSSTQDVLVDDIWNHFHW